MLVFFILLVAILKQIQNNNKKNEKPPNHIDTDYYANIQITVYQSYVWHSYQNLSICQKFAFEISQNLDEEILVIVNPNYL